MSMETDFRAILVGNATLVGLVSTRVFPSTYAQAAASPAIRYQKITGSTGLHMQGSDGLSNSTMQVDVRVSTVLPNGQGANAAQIAETIRDRIVALLHGFADVQGATDFRLIELSSDRGIQFDDAGPTKYYSASVDFNVWSRAA